jgi:putative FmdB family regulatory protein
MPIYEYRCQQCGHELEKLQRMSDAPLVDCPACEKPGLKRLISAAGFRLKGGGWYETDFKQGQKRNLVEGADAKKDSTESPKKDSGDSSKSAETKTSKPKSDGGSTKTTASSDSA